MSLCQLCRRIVRVNEIAADPVSNEPQHMRGPTAFFCWCHVHVPSVQANVAAYAQGNMTVHVLLDHQLKMGLFEPRKMLSVQSQHLTRKSLITLILILVERNQ